jgi:hypothetical protein
VTGAFYGEFLHDWIFVRWADDDADYLRGGYRPESIGRLSPGGR